MIALVLFNILVFLFVFGRPLLDSDSNDSLFGVTLFFNGTILLLRLLIFLVALLGSCLIYATVQ